MNIVWQGVFNLSQLMRTVGEGALVPEVARGSDFEKFAKASFKLAVDLLLEHKYLGNIDSD
jgi:hypothetical protein